MKDLLAQLAAFYLKYKHIAEEDDRDHVEHLLEEYMNGGFEHDE